MQTKILMIISAIFMAAIGLAASFMPGELLDLADAWSEVVEVSLVQVLGALYLGFALLNWTARAHLTGSVYSRPIVLANFMHTGLVTVIFGKLWLANYHTLPVIAGLVIYAIFAICFAIVLLRLNNPKQAKE